MLTKVLMIAGLLLMLLPAYANVNAQTRIRLAPGRYSATVVGDLAYNQYRQYVVRAREGQSIVARLVSNTGSVVIAEDYSYQYILDANETGDYTIDIMNTGPYARYRLTVTISKTPR